MQYSNGNILLLYDGRTVYVSLADEKMNCYHVFDMEDENDTFIITDEDVADLVLTA